MRRALCWLIVRYLIQSCPPIPGATSNEDTAKKNVEASDPNKIPLHAGSRVYVSKHDLKQIFIPNACIYTSRLCELVFGLDLLQRAAQVNVKVRKRLLDPDLLKSIITHVVQAFRLRGENIEENIVMSFIEHKMRTLQAVAGSTTH